MRKLNRTTWFLAALLTLVAVGVAFGQDAQQFFGPMEYYGRIFLGRGVGLIFDGATADSNYTTISVTDPTAARTFTLPDASGTATIGGLKVFAGTVGLDGSNPTSVSTGATALTGCNAQYASTATPALDPYVFTMALTASAGRLDIYAWKATSSSDPTLVASTSGALMSYVCLGTP